MIYSFKAWLGSRLFSCFMGSIVEEIAITHFFLSESLVWQTCVVWNLKNQSPPPKYDDSRREDVYMNIQTFVNLL